MCWEKKLEEEVLRLSYIKNEVGYNEEEKWKHSIQEYEKKDTRKHTQHFYTQYKSWKEINEEVEIVILVNGQYSQDPNLTVIIFLVTAHKIPSWK